MNEEEKGVKELERRFTSAVERIADAMEKHTIILTNIDERLVALVSNELPSLRGLLHTRR